MSPLNWMWIGVLVAIVPMLCLGALVQRGVQCLHPTRPHCVPLELPEPQCLASERIEYPPPQIVVVLPPSQVQYLPYTQQFQPRVIDALPAIEGSWDDGPSQSER